MANHQHIDFKTKHLCESKIVMLFIWWNPQGLVYYELIKSNKNGIREVTNQQFDRFKRDVYLKLIAITQYIIRIYETTKIKYLNKNLPIIKSYSFLIASSISIKFGI